MPPSALQAVKLWLVDNVGLAKDALHIYVALTLFFGTAVLFGWKLSSWKPWAVVAVAAIAGEAWDIRDSVVYHTPLNLWGNWHDIWNTMFWPTAMLMFSHSTKLFKQRTK